MQSPPPPPPPKRWWKRRNSADRAKGRAPAKFYSGGQQPQLHLRQQQQQQISGRDRRQGGGEGGDRGRFLSYRILNLAAGRGGGGADNEEDEEEGEDEGGGDDEQWDDWNQYLEDQEDDKEGPGGGKSNKRQERRKIRSNFPSPPVRHYVVEEDLSPVCACSLFGVNLYFNPWVTLISLALLWAFVVVTAVLRNQDYLVTGRQYIAGNFTWLYVGSFSAWVVFLVIVYFSEYGNMKLGGDKERPEYNFLSWFSMLFSAGIGISLFFYGVAETIQHYTKRNRYTANAFLPDNLLAQLSLNYTLFHLGVYGWAVYTVIGLLLGLLVHREGLPMAMKTCFFPLIGLRIFGWLGDFISVVSVTTTIIGIGISLAAGALQVNAGLNVLSPSVPINIVVEVRVSISLHNAVTVSLSDFPS